MKKEMFKCEKVLASLNLQNTVDNQPQKAILVRYISLLLIFLVSAVLCIGCDAESERNKDHILKYMENKYDIEFEIVSARSDGSKGTSSYNVVSPVYPNTVTTVGIMEAGTTKEWINEDYGFYLFRDQYEDHYRTRLKDFFGDKVYVGFAFCMETEDTAVFQEAKVDLKELSFEKIGESGGGIIYGYDISIFFIRDIPNDNYEPIYQEVFNWLMYLKRMNMTYARFQMMGFSEKSLLEPGIAEIVKKVNNSNGKGSGRLYDALMDLDRDNGKYFTYGSGSAIKFDLAKIETLDDVKKILTIEWDK